MNTNNDRQKILRVSRSREQARESYDRMSGLYDYFAGIFEKRFRNMALEGMCIKKGEKILEAGFGTGQCLKQIAESVGETGRAYGIDISSGMLEAARKRLEKAGLAGRVVLQLGDAAKLPFDDRSFDGVFSSFTLELFDTPDIPVVLDEVRRVLRPGGRLGIVSMSKEDGDSILLKLYEWFHEKFPKYVDCRPIYAERSLRNAGFEIRHKEKVNMFGLPGEIVVAEEPAVMNA